MSAPQELERRLGYIFSDRALLQQALTHRSFGVPHNERLEFLGDSLLNCAIATLLYNHFQNIPEGPLSRLRANLVNQAVLARIAGELEIGRLLRMGEGELKTGGASRPSILADAVEAILGGVFLDGGFDVAVATVERVFARDFAQIDQLEPIKDAKTALQEWLQARKRPLPEYTVLRIEGEAHKQIFYVQCQIDSADLITIGQGGSRRAAEQDAAGLAIHELQSRSQVKKQ